MHSFMDDPLRVVELLVRLDLLHNSGLVDLLLLQGVVASAVIQVVHLEVQVQVSRDLWDLVKDLEELERNQLDLPVHHQHQSLDARGGQRHVQGVLNGLSLRLLALVLGFRVRFLLVVLLFLRWLVLGALLSHIDLGVDDRVETHQDLLKHGL